MKFAGEDWHWKTKEGERVHIQDMETSHIHNCIKMIERNGFTEVYNMSGGYDSEDMFYEEYEQDFTLVYNNMILELRLRAKNQH